MNRNKAKELGFTNDGYQFKFIPVYIKFDDETLETVGKNMFWDFLLSIFVQIDLFFETGYSFTAYLNENKL